MRVNKNRDWIRGFDNNRIKTRTKWVILEISCLKTNNFNPYLCFYCITIIFYTYLLMFLFSFPNQEHNIFLKTLHGIRIILNLSYMIKKKNLLKVKCLKSIWLLIAAAFILIFAWHTVSNLHDTIALNWNLFQRKQTQIKTTS